MLGLSFIEKAFQQVREYNVITELLMVFVTILGILVLLLQLLKLTWLAIKLFRLYVVNQYISRTDYTKKYGRWVCIAGGTDGIGFAIAKEFAKRGHSLIVIGRNNQKLAEVQAILVAQPNAGQVVTVRCDFSESSQANYDNLRNQLEIEKRKIGILVNSAGVCVSEYRRFNKIPLDELQNMVNVNVLATMSLTRLVLPGMLERGGGLILNVSSSLGCTIGPFLGVYSPTKAFINSFSKLLQTECKHQPVDVINITPGVVTTKLYLQLASGLTSLPCHSTPEGYAKSTINAVASGRIKRVAGSLNDEIVYSVLKLLDYFNQITLMLKLSVYLKNRNSEKSTSWSQCIE